MNILNRLTTLSLDDLHKLQLAVLKEIQRRKQTAGTTADILVMGAQKQGKGVQSAPASKPRSATVPPVPKRRAA